nr:hypothetical protein [Tanacetum cinerariifolium]GEX55653.1 hypothetical protein [Tanacetum cinerariifolium]
INKVRVEGGKHFIDGIPNEHQLKFNFIKDTKSLLQAVEKRFGGNAATKKTQRNLLNQQYENFTASSSEVGQRDIKQKHKHKHTKHNFVSSNNTNNTNRAVNTTDGATIASTQATAVNFSNIDNLSGAVICAFLASQPSSPQLVNEDLEQIYPNNLKEMDLKWQMTMLTMRARRFLKKTSKKQTINGNETIGFNKSNVECYNYHKKGHFARKCKALRYQDTK